MKIIYFLIPNFAVASIAVGAAIATVNQPATQLSIPLTEPITFPTSPTPESARAVPTPQSEPLSTRSPVTIYGIGAVRVGMTLEQAEQASGVSIIPGVDEVDNGVLHNGG